MTARVEAERAIADVLAGHQDTGYWREERDVPEAVRWMGISKWIGRCSCGVTLQDTTHQTHLAHVLADLMAERQAEALNEVARWLGTVYQVNPMNHDGSNHTIDRVVQQLDRQAGTNAPSRAFEDAWDERMDKYEADYYGGDGKQRRARRALARLATDGPDPKDTRDE